MLYRYLYVIINYKYYYYIGNCMPAAEDAPANSNQAKPRPAALAGRAPQARDQVKILNTYSRLPDEGLRKSLIDLVDALAKASPAR